MAECQLITIDQPQAWDEAIARCGRYDSYHLAGYHTLAQSQGEGEPYLLIVEDAGHAAALPFVVRPVRAVAGLEDSALNDASSVYGYPGVVTTLGRSDPRAEGFRLSFQRMLAEALQPLGVVCLFVRQNPLIDTSWLLSPLAETTRVGLTVAIDLTQPQEQQWQAFRKNHRSDITRAQREGLVVREDAALAELGTFRHIYIQTMDHLGASDYYYFDQEYFDGLRRLLPGRVKLLFAEFDSHVIAAALFLLCGDIIQYHLGGTVPEFLKFRGGMKTIFNEMRRWGSEHGFSWLHLGGGLGARQDSLFQFKAGFSHTHLSFEATRLIVEPDVYQQLLTRRQRWLVHEGYDTQFSEYFPAYRQAPRRLAA